MKDAEHKSVDELWLGTLQDVCARAAHEMKGVLNGVSVNLEVVRSRAARANATASAVASFAESASDQFSRLTDMSESLMLLCRAPREPVEVSATVSQLVTLLQPVARVEGHSLGVTEAKGAGAVRARGNVVRLLLARALLSALDCKADVHCNVELGDDAVVRITAGGNTIKVPSEVSTAAVDAGIRVKNDNGCISLAFPRAGRRAHERA